MNIQKLISELQERNRKATRTLKTYSLSPELEDNLLEYINNLITDSFNQGALAVIEEVRKVQYGTNGEGQKWVMMSDLEDHLKTLEDKLKDI